MHPSKAVRARPTVHPPLPLGPFSLRVAKAPGKPERWPQTHTEGGAHPGSLRRQSCHRNEGTAVPCGKIVYGSSDKYLKVVFVVPNAGRLFGGTSSSRLAKMAWLVRAV